MMSCHRFQRNSNVIDDFIMGIDLSLCCHWLLPKIPWASRFISPNQSIRGIVTYHHPNIISGFTVDRVLSASIDVGHR
jgi:hypothetical protein